MKKLKKFWWNKKMFNENNNNIYMLISLFHCKTDKNDVHKSNHGPCGPITTQLAKTSDD